MIARLKKRPRQTPVPAWHAAFLAMLPAIQRQAKVAFRHLDAEAREEAVQEVTAYAAIAFKELWDRGKAELAYPSVLALYGIKRVKIGRMTATPMNSKDVSSTYCQLQKNISLERLDKFDKYEGAWLEAVVEDHHTPVIDQVWFRIDFPAWLSGFPDRDRQIAEALAAGNRTGEVAEEFEVSAGRVSQMRREFWTSWEEFHGEKSSGDRAAAGTAPSRSGRSSRSQAAGVTSVRRIGLVEQP